MHAHFVRLAKQQDSIVTWRQLRRGMTKTQVLMAVEPFRQLHDGVWLAGFGEPTQRQLWRAAVLTESGSLLAGASAAALYGIREDRQPFEVVVRPGTTGPRRCSGLLVLHSLDLAGQWHVRDGLPVLKVERVICDLACAVGPWQTRKMLREALRLRLTTRSEVNRARWRLAGRRGVGIVAEWLAEYGSLPFDRCKSDAEARGLEVLRDAGVPPPSVNEVFAGFEADFCWPDRMLIVEIDGPQWHRDKLLDARKTARWRAAGFEVRRVSSDDVFDRPRILVAAATAASEHELRAA